MIEIPRRIIPSRVACAALTLGLAIAPLGAIAQDSLTGCPATAERAWIDDGSVSAIALGPSCETAALVLMLRDGEGALLYVGAHHPQDLFGFEEATVSPAAMTAALEDWVAGGWPERGGELPEWDDEAQGALGGEFPFYVEPWLDAELYNSIRDENGPILCYIQGMESLACIARYPDAFGAWVRIGAQSFPG